MFQFSDRAQELRERLLAFMDRHVYPAESLWKEQHRALASPWQYPAIMDELKAEARAQGLWNLFLPHEAGRAYGGAGLSNLDYAPLCEIMGRSPLGPEVFNCNAPDTGNMEILALYGSEAQKETWLRPLMEGRIRSCFSMTEPDVASSDATNIRCTIVRDGDSYVVSGRKWWSSGGNSERCRLAIVMGKSDPEAPPHKQQSMILVPLDAPGVRIERGLSVFGYDHAPHGHAEILYEAVRVPLGNLLLGEGRGFEIAQGRLGPGRIHHCMRLVGLAERALEALCRRALAREAFGRPLAEQGTVRRDIARSRCEIEQARLLTLKAAALMDSLGNKAARGEIAMIKVVAPAMACRVIDRAIQVHGGAGVSEDFFLASAYAKARSLRLADGPDEVHEETITRLELKAYGGNRPPAAAG
ncbi:MAG: acyl-CoA dehydrogenase family protein [Tistlia sp.]|uniref:acyl-CoA dehydrogenase family protein n=1 Tax=Tistlia sp. TaxID=3057121 RepID=UPI0034A0D54F